MSRAANISDHTVMLSASPQPSRRNHRLFALVFFASGFAGLIYESIWSHYLKLFLGHAAYAQTLVLAIFMGGMAIGAATAGRLVGRLRSPLRGYALVELAVGLLALAFHGVFITSTEALYAWAAGAATGPGVFAVAKWLLASALILPASILLGATFPLFAAGFARSTPGREGFALATLYFANSLGGAIGVLASGFWAIPALGLPGTIAAAGACNLLIALVMWRLGGSGGTDRPTAEPVPPVARTGSALGVEPPPPRSLATLLLTVSCLTGASSFIYEVGWIRMLSLAMGSATHSFELMLSAFILGLALGGLWIRRRLDREGNLGMLLGKIQVWMGICALATLPMYQVTFDFVGWLVSTLPKDDTGYLLLNLGRYSVAVAIMLPAAFCAGMTLPLATRLLFAQPDQGERAIGRIYSWNTVGAIAGVAFAVHVGFTYLGLKHLVAFAALIDIALGLWLLMTFARDTVGRFSGLALTSSALGALAIAAGFDPQHLTSGVYRSGQARLDNEVIALADGKTATVSVDREVSGALLIRTNGKPDASVRMAGPGYKMDEVTMALIASVPLAMHPTPARVANIGFGAGITGNTVLSDPRVAVLDTIEIEPRMVELAEHFRPFNARVYDDPRSRIHIDDAKSFFAASGQRYDLILSEPSNPWVSGVAGLFSVEFYRQIKRHLAAGGLFAQWVQAYEIDEDRVVSIMKAMDAEFADYVVVALNYGDLLLVASPDRQIALPADALDQLAPANRRLLDRLDVRSNGDLIYRVLGNRQLFSPWLAAQPAPANSDFRPYLDQHADRDRFVGATWAPGMIDGELSPYLLSEVLGGRPPLPDPAAITLNEHFGRQHPAAGAQGLMQLIEGHMNAPRSGSEAAARQAGQTLLNDCRQPPAGDATYALVRIVASALPYLSQVESQRLLTVLADAPCLQIDGPTGAQWRLLAEQLAHRDSGYGPTAAALLAAGEGRTAPRARFLLGLAVTGYLQRGEADLATTLWSRHAGRLAPEASRGLALQVLDATLTAPPGGDMPDREPDRRSSQ